MDPHDRAALRAHRTALLALQHLTPEALARRTGRVVVARDLALAVAYTAYALPLGTFVLREGTHQGHFGLSAVLAAFAALFFVIMWRGFFASLRQWRRAKSYEGVLVRVDADLHAEFEGGSVILPHDVRTQLVPGVRYRVHAPGTDEVAVDVALDENDAAKHRGAYR